MKKTILVTAAVLAMSGTAMAGSLVDIDQIGVDNVASSVQLTGSGNEAHIRQTGDQNSSITKQDGSNNYLRVRQDTNNNEVGNDAANTALSQTGKNNMAYVDQMGGDHNAVRKAGSTGNNNLIRIKQTGNWNGQGNNLDGTISGMPVTEANFSLHGATRQASAVVQNGNSNTAKINENGFGQSFEIYQGFAGNTATGSTVVLTQHDAVNYAYAQQTGSDHTANIYQEGHLNRVFVKQAN